MGIHAHAAGFIDFEPELERLLDEVSFEGPDLPEKSITIDAAYVDRMLAEIDRLDEIARGFEEVCRISADASKIAVLVVPADEERMMAREALRTLSRSYITQVLEAQKQQPFLVEVSAHHIHLTQEHVEALQHARGDLLALLKLPVAVRIAGFALIPAISFPTIGLAEITIGAALIRRTPPPVRASRSRTACSRRPARKNACRG